MNKSSSQDRQRRCVAYLRVSTSKQELDNQKLGVVEFAEKEGLTPLEFVTEMVSGTAKIADRKLAGLIADLQEGDVLIVSELSRLGRRMADVFVVLEQLISRGVVIYEVKAARKLDTSIGSRVLTVVLSLVAEIERDLIVQRTREGLARRKAEGKTLGRPKGSFGVSKLDGLESQIRDLVAKGVNRANICRVVGASRPTLDTFMERKGIRYMRQRPRLAVGAVSER